MELKRNVELKDQTTVVRHIRYRTDVCDKVTKYVRIYGHRKPEAIVQQWMKSHAMIGRSIICRTPSRKSMYRILRWTAYLTPTALPSHISLRTTSQLASPTFSSRTFSRRTFTQTTSIAKWLDRDDPILRLLSYASHGTNDFMRSEKSAAIFNDFQHILDFHHDDSKQPELVDSTRFTRDVWYPALG